MADVIRIRVGCSVDKNVGSAFRPIVEAAKDARRQVEAEMDRAWAAVSGKGQNVGKAGQGPYRSVVREAERAATQIIATERRKQDRIVAEAIRTQRRVEAEQRKATRERERSEYDQRAAKASAFKKAQAFEQKENVGRLRGVAGGSVETLGKIGRGALGVAGSVARGAGVQTDLASYVGQAVNLETMAGDLSSAAYSEGRDKGKRIDPRELIRSARSVGNDAAFDPTQIIEGMQAYVGSTGDLATVQAALPNIAKLARATGTDLSTMISAAGKVGNALGDWGEGQPFATAAKKGEALVNVLRQLAGQGKVGSVEMKDLAVYGGKLAAASMAFTNNPTQNLSEMGALAQIAMQGGASSAAEAATSVAGFVNTLKTPAREKEFNAHGVHTRDEQTGRFFSIAEILQDASMGAVERGGGVAGATTQWKKMFANVQGAKAADPAFNAFLSAYSAELKNSKSKSKAEMAGIQAINDLLGKFGAKASISADEEKTSFDRSMKTSAAQVQLFNNKLSEIGGQIAEKVLPQLQKLAPYIVQASEAFAKMVTFAAENPGTAIAAAVVASIGKAAIGSAVSATITKLIEGAAGSAGAMKGLNSLAIVASAITIASVGMLVIDSVMNEMDKGVNKSVEQDIKASEAIRGGNRASREVVATGNEEADIRAATAKRREQGAALAEAQAQQAAIVGRIKNIGEAGNLGNVLFGNKTFEDVGQAKSDVGKTDQLVADYKALSAVIQNLTTQLGKPLIVKGEVNVAGGAPGPTANIGNTTK